MKILTVIGARPQFIKAAAVSRVLRREHTEVLLHTGQHYDATMSDVFFRELQIPAPERNLNIGSGPHGKQTGLMLAGIEEALVAEKPDWTLVYGDTNSTLAGALASAKLHVPVAHVEAGLRSYNRAMPEEINRLLVDHLADSLFCPSQIAIENLQKEGITNGVHLLGDVMADVLGLALQRLASLPDVLGRFALTKGNYYLLTVHRAENTDDPEKLRNILRALAAAEMPVLFPVHPRTKKCLASLKYTPPQHVCLVEPVGYLDMVGLQRSAAMILTDSGGIQKEAYWVGVPCLTLRSETEWVETVQCGWNKLVGTEVEAIVQGMRSFKPPVLHPALYGDGQAAARLGQWFSRV